MDHATLLALALDPSQILVRQGLTPDPLQRDLLRHVGALSAT